MSDDDIFRASVRERAEHAVANIRDTQRELYYSHVALLKANRECQMLEEATADADIKIEMDVFDMVLKLLSGEEVLGVKV